MCLKKVLSVCLLLLSFAVKGFSQETLNNNYELPTPENWRTETFDLPAPFAADIPFKGTEHIRFSPGWRQKQAEDYWTYCFLWAINSQVSFTKTNLEQYLNNYYTGLVKANLAQAKIDTTIAIPVKVKLNSSRKSKTDIQAFNGQVEMLDYMTQDPIKLNLLIHIKKPKQGTNSSAVYFEVSPKPYDHKVWIKLDEFDQAIK
ncbi:MAG: hypothetical protein AAGC65_15430 [Mucilaginibacter sp.]|uniref:hypothetical protein n=1 Tax=Mucilaginibacter sp. TaxID=1882438 RepID=UPI0031AAE25B